MEVNRYMVPAELPTGQEYFKLPFNELNAALASKQATYDKSEAEVSALDKLFPQAGYRTEERAAAYKEKYTTEIDALKKQLQETGRLNPYKITDVASRMIKDPEYAAINQDFKYREAVDKMMSAGNFQDYIQNFHNGVGYNQTKPGESFSGDWYRALPPADYIPEYKEMTQFKPIRYNIEQSSGMTPETVTNPDTGESEVWMFDKRTKTAVEKLTKENIEKYLTSDNKALLNDLYQVKGLPGKSYREAWYEKTYGKPYSEDAFFADLMQASKYNQYNYTQTEDISRKVGEINASHKSGSGSGANASASPAESITTSAWTSFNLPKNLDSFAEQKDYLSNFVMQNQKFIADQEQDLKTTVAKQFGLDPKSVDAKISRDPVTGKVSVTANTANYVMTENDQINLHSILKPYEQAITQEFNVRDGIRNLWKQHGLIDNNGNFKDGQLVATLASFDKERNEYYFDKEYSSLSPFSEEGQTYMNLYKQDPLKAHEYYKSNHPKDAEKWESYQKDMYENKLANLPQSTRENIDRLNKSLQSLQSAVIPAVSWYTPTNTPGDVRIALGQFRNAMITYTNSDKVPTYRADGKQLSPEDFQKFNELINVVDDAATASDDKALNFASKAPGFVTYRFDPSKGLVMDVTMPGFTRQDASKVNKNTQAQASAVTFEMSPSQQEAVKEQLGMTGEDESIAVMNDMNLHFHGNENMPGNPGLPYKVGTGKNAMTVSLDDVNSRLLGDNVVKVHKVNYHGIDLTLNNPRLQNDNFLISQLWVLLKTLEAYDAPTFDKVRPQIEKTLQSRYGLSSEIANKVLNEAR